MSRDVVDRAKNSLNVYEHCRASGVVLGTYPELLVKDLLAEVERLRWQVRHGDSDHMCDECFPT